jgi:hypothetical protein
MTQPLRPTNKEFREELKSGDHVIFQSFIEMEKDEIPTVQINIREIEQIDIENNTITFKDSDIPQPRYRIRYVIKDNLSYGFQGYDDMAICRDEGQITDETYNEIVELRKGNK